MKLSGRALQDYVANPTKGFNAALLYGPDAGQVRERLKALCNKLSINKADPFAYVELTEEELKTDPARLADECGAMSFGGGMRTVYARGLSDRMTKAVEAALPLLGSGCYLLISAEELGPRSSLRLLFEQGKNLAAIACYKDEGVDLQSLIRSYMERSNLQIDRDAIDYMAAHLGNDRAVTLSELEKLSLYKLGAGRVTLDDVMLLINENRDSAFDDINNALAERDLSRLDYNLQQMLNEGMQPIAIMRSAQKHFQRLYGLRAGFEAGKSIDQVVAEARPPIFFRAQASFKKQLRYWDRPRLAHVLQVLMKAELECKSTGSIPQLLCSNVFLKIAAELA